MDMEKKQSHNKIQERFETIHAMEYLHNSWQPARNNTNCKNPEINTLLESRYNIR